MSKGKCEDLNKKKSSISTGWGLCGLATAGAKKIWGLLAESNFNLSQLFNVAA
jgi:hypothetical protein